MQPAGRWWKEWELWAVLLLAGLIYGTRLGAALPTGEEPRRGQVAREMINSGDWIVPRQQGQPFLSRPPVQNWLIAAVALCRGQVDAVAIRLPSVVALLLTIILVYGYGRTFLSRLGALWAAAAYPTMGLVLQFGWLGETESLYTLVVGGSLIAWRWADAVGRTSESVQRNGTDSEVHPTGVASHRLLAWCGGYALAALGMLTKGPQAPVYFVAGVGLFLLVTRRWRELFRWQHAAGIAVFLTIWLAWQIPFCLRVTPHEAWVMLTGDMAMRFQDRTLLQKLKHFVEFPVSVAACILPWGVMLIAYCYKDFRRRIAAVRADVWFLALSIGFAFLSCYVVPGARNRYLAPMLPLVALLIGLAAQECFAAAIEPLQRLRQRYFIGMAVVAVGLGLWIVTATVLRLGPFKGEQPPLFAAAFALAAGTVAAIALRASARPAAVWERVGVLSLAALFGLTFLGAVVNTYVASRHPIAAEIAAATADLPPSAELVSIGPVDDVFLYYYGRPIRRLADSEGLGQKPRDWTWFCMGNGSNIPRFDPPYEEIAEISVDPATTPGPHDHVIIGRLIPATAGVGPSRR